MAAAGCPPAKAARLRRRWGSLPWRHLRFPLRPGPLPRSMAAKVERAKKVERAAKVERAVKAEPVGDSGCL